MTIFLFVVAISMATQVKANDILNFSAQRMLGNSTIGNKLEFVSVSTELYTNSTSTDQLSWVQLSGELFHIVYLSGATPIPITQSAVFSPFNITNWNGLPDGKYEIYVSGVNNVKRSVSGSLVLDNLTPDQATGLSLAVGGVAVSGPNSSRTVTLSWVAAQDTVPIDATVTNASKYEVSYNHSTITETFLSTEVSGTSYQVVLPSNVPDTTIVFTVYSVDSAGNKNPNVTSDNQISYVLNTTAPNTPSNLVLKNTDGDILTGVTGGRFGDLSFTHNQTGVTYEIAYRTGNNDFVVLSSGSEVKTYSNLFATGFNPAEGSSVTLRVVAIDGAGNRSPDLSRTIVYDSVAPSFVISYLDGGVFTSAAGVVINQSNINSLVVTNALNDIQSYQIKSNNQVIHSATGTSAELQAYLRRLATDGVYEVIARDAALNQGSFNLNVKVQGPRFGVSRSIVVNGNDVREDAGVQASITVDFEASPDVVIGQSGTYKLFVDGREIIGTTPQLVGGKVQIAFEMQTAFYGDVQSVYVVQAVDEFGNTVNYTSNTNTIIRDRMRPTARVLETFSTDSTITATIELLDNNRVLTLAGARAELYNGTVLVTTIPLTVGRSNYTFSNLRERQTNYNIRVVGSYSWNNVSLDNVILNGAVPNEGTRFAIDTLKVTPDVTATIQNIVSTTNSITLDIQSQKNVNVTRFIDVTLYAGTGPYTGNPVKTERIELPQSQINRLSEVTFLGLTSGVNYHIQVREGGAILATARTITNLPIPTSTFEVTDVKQTEATASINITNTNSATAYIFQGTNLVSQQEISLTGGVNRIVFPNLQANTTYNVKVIAAYTAFVESQNGSVQEINVGGEVVGNYNFTTAKQMLSGELINVDVLDDEVLFTVVLEDPNNALVIGHVALYLGQNLVDEIRIDRGTNGLKFENLQPNSDYTLSIQITYNLQDGKGEETKEGFLDPSALSRSFVIRRFKTIKTLPDVEITQVNRTDKTLSVTIRPIDPNEAFVTGTVRIFSLTAFPPLIKSETLLRAPFHRETVQTFTFSDLQANTTYRIEVELDYNLEDGRGTRVYKPINEEYRTRQSVSAEILTVNTTSERIQVEIELFDYTSATVLGKIFEGANQIGSAIQLQNGRNNLQFDNLKENTSYRLVFDYNNGAQLLASRNVQTQQAVELVAPVLSLVTPSITNNTAVIQIRLTDVDNTINPSVEIDICDENSDSCTKEVRTVSQVLAGTEVELPYEDQTVTLRLTYTTNAAPQTIELPTTISLRSPVVPPIPQPPTPQPIEPINGNMGVVVASVIGTLAIGFVGVFIYSFRKMYIQ